MSEPINLTSEEQGAETPPKPRRQLGRSTQNSGPPVRDASSMWFAFYPALMMALLLGMVAVFLFGSRTTNAAARNKFRQAMELSQDTKAKDPGDFEGNASPTMARRNIRTVHNAQDSTAFSFLKTSRLTNKEIDEFFKKLKDINTPTLEDNFTLRLPFNYLFEPTGALAEEGKRNLKGLTDHLKKLPYDLVLQVNEEEHVGKIFTLVKYFTSDAKLPASRFGISVRPEKNDDVNKMTFILLAQK